MTALTSTEWSLAARPVGMPKLSDFQMKTIDIAPGSPFATLARGALQDMDGGG